MPIKDIGTLEEEFHERVSTPSDINEHLFTLLNLAIKCDHITEFGVRSGNSTVALAMGMPNRLISYDINPMPANLEALIKGVIPFQFIQANTLEITIEPTELLFIDTLHTYDQLSEELLLHADMVSKYIVLHDTATFGAVGEDGKAPGLTQAMMYFLDHQAVWKILKCDTNNNGLTILEREK